MEGVAAASVLQADIAVDSQFMDAEIDELCDSFNEV